MREDGPAVSVVIPARNAEGTLARAVESLSGQTEGSFEAILVENGSADATAAVALRLAALDERVRVARRAAAGVSAARNAGIGLARGEWLLFLDADDELEPAALERLLAVARRTPRPDAAVCGWVRVAPDGTRFGDHVWRNVDRAFDSLAVTCGFAIHCCLVRRELVVAAGGFDETLRTCEDWDLWLRLARMGARFRAVDECLALYNVSPRTASLDGRRMLSDGLEVIGRAHGPDPRVAQSDARFASGRDRALLVPARLSCACYSGGLVLGASEDARSLLAALGDARDPEFDPVTAAWIIYGAATLPSCRPPARWDEVWPLIEPRLDPFLAGLEARTTPGFAARARRELEGIVLRESGASLEIGPRRAVRVELSRPIETLELSLGTSRVACTVELEGEPFGRLELPVCDGRVPRDVLADALAADFFWPLLGRFYGLDPDEHDGVGWETFLRDLWGETEAPGMVRGAFLRLECSEELPDVQAASRTVRVEATVGGAPVGVVELRARRGARVSASELRSAITDGCGLELAVAAVREVLIGRPMPVGARIRHLLQAASAERSAVIAANGNGTLVLPRWPGPIRGPASRRAALPAEVAGEFAVALASPPDHVLYEPALISRERPRRRLRTFRRPAPIPVVESAVVTERLPILMYHRIADDGPQELRRYRLDPADFEQQLDYLRSAGYRGLTLEEWRCACERRKPLRGRAVMITFDDGYRDFAESAWPLLERYGFPAIVFLVAGEMGGTSRWDRHLGGDAPLLSWREARRLRGRGVEFGSHTISHPALCSVSNADVVREAVRSRALMEERLGSPPTAIAYPYGDADTAVAHLVGACGYTFGFTDGPGRAELAHPLLLMPRIEVRGTDSLDDFVAKLTTEP